MSRPAYEIVRPLFFFGERVRAYPHKGPAREGTIHMVQTSYTKDHRAYHTYCIAFDGYERWQHVGERKIIESFLNPKGGDSDV